MTTPNAMHRENVAATARAAIPDPNQVLTPDEVIRILRLDAIAPRNPREALRNLVRRGSLACLRSNSCRNARCVFLRRHVDECLARWERWGLDRRQGAVRRPRPGAAMSE